MTSVILARDARATIGEGPVWFDERLWWSDPVARRLWTLDREPAATARGVWSLAVLGGDLIGALDDGFARVAPDGGQAEGPAATLSPGCRFNDMVADPQGGLWVGAMHRGLLAGQGAIYRSATPDAPPIAVADGLGVPNGMALSADSATLFVIDTLARTLLAYPVAGDMLGEPAVVADFLDMRGKPDGMAIAPDGSFYVAMWGGGAVAHLAPDGSPLRLIEIPAPHVSSLCFAGADRLFVTTSRMRMAPAALATFPQSGGVFEVSLA